MQIFGVCCCCLFAERCLIGCLLLVVVFRLPPTSLLVQHRTYFVSQNTRTQQQQTHQHRQRQTHRSLLVRAPTYSIMMVLSPVRSSWKVKKSKRKKVMFLKCGVPPLAVTLLEWRSEAWHMKTLFGFYIFEIWFQKRFEIRDSRLMSKSDTCLFYDWSTSFLNYQPYRDHFFGSGKLKVENSTSRNQPPIFEYHHRLVTVAESNGRGRKTHQIFEHSQTLCLLSFDTHRIVGN